MGSVYDFLDPPAPTTPPEGSLYFWCYSQGLRGCLLGDIEIAVRPRTLREKDIRNYWAGLSNSILYKEKDKSTIFDLSISGAPRNKLVELWEYPDNPLAFIDVDNRWVPCNADNKPMIKWGKGCMSIEDAKAMPGQVYLAENLKGTRFIVLDIDGDHGDEKDMDTVWQFSELARKTNCLYKDEDPVVSYHLTFQTTKLIPTMHFPQAHLDICGNRNNQLRYIKKKKSNGLPPALLDDDVWHQVMRFVERRTANA